MNNALINSRMSFLGIIRTFVISSLAALAAGQSLAAIPNDLLTAGYQVYTADINGDGCPDFLIRAPNQYVPISIDDDISIIIPIAARFPALQLTSVGTCGSMALTVLPASISYDPRWLPAAYSVLVGDVVGLGGGSLLIAPTNSSNSYAFSISRSNTDGSYTYLQSLQLATFGLGSGTTLSFQYVNSDSRSDLVAMNGANVVAAFTAGTDGRFTSGTSDMVSLTTIVWKSFLGALSSTNPNNALQMVAGYSNDVFATAINTPGATPQGFATIISSFDVIDVQPTYVRAVISIQRNGETDLFYVLFGKDADGYWKIFSI